ncbi:MAG: hypothetical protein H6Q89_2876 [Myxococcaceae bacterium]|nr:hypothetical protein [Myxococcaceae bacterium]
MRTSSFLLLLVLACTACGANPELTDAGSGGGAGGGTGGAGGGGAGGAGGGCDPTVDLATNPLHCGTCGNTCQFPNGVAACTAGVCGLKSCAAGFRNLDGVAANGCEATCSPLVVAASGSLDFDLPVIQLSGRVTLGGQRAPDGNPRGTLRFELSGSKAVEVPLPATGEATFGVKLFAGHYRVLLVKAGDCRPGVLPCGSQLLRAGPLTASGALDFDVAGGSSSGLIAVTGAVTANGAALAAGPRGAIRFSSDAGVVASSVLPASGTASYSVMLSPGVYDVLVEGDPACPSNAVLPCQRSIRRRALALSASGNLDLDLPIVQVSGAVTVNGQAVAGASTERGRLKLVDVDGEGPSVSLGTTGPAQWTTRVYAGAHDVVVSRAGCSAGPLPCQTRKARSAVPLTAAGVLDLDLKVLDVSGQVLANGQALGPSSRGSSRGTLSLKSEGSGPSVDLGISGAATYQVKLYEGSYELAVDNPADCPFGPLPCGAKAVKTAAFGASGVLDVDVAVVKASGAVTVNGMPMGTSTAPRGTLSFEGPTRVPVPLTAGGAASWNATLYPGTYRIELTNQSSCEAGPVPCQKRVLDAARSLTADGAITWDLPVVDVTGAVTLNGQAVSAPSANVRGELLFREPSAGTVAIPLGTSGAALWRARLYPASYQVLFRNTLDCPASDTQPLPCQGEAEIAPSEPLTASGSKDFNLQSVTLSGLVQVNGSQMGPSATGQSRGVLRFAPFAASPAPRPLSSSGAATYQVRLLPGRYDVGIENVSDCGAAGALPCQKHVLAGCAAP